MAVATLRILCKFAAAAALSHYLLVAMKTLVEVTMEQRDLLRGVPKPQPLYVPEPIKEQFLKVLCLYFLLSCLLPDLIAEFGTPAQACASGACVRRQNLVESPDISTPPALVEEMTTAEDDEDVPEH